mmetsp:Transcript_33945/g.80588  ORF Transcript_33945/g.80588 Transcript_33945/m.80588 type:complete len:489 (+) Transcript_33945:414-1880(+)
MVAARRACAAFFFRVFAFASPPAGSPVALPSAFLDDRCGLHFFSLAWAEAPAAGVVLMDGRRAPTRAAAGAPPSLGLGFGCLLGSRRGRSLVAEGDARPLLRPLRLLPGTEADALPGAFGSPSRSLGTTGDLEPFLLPPPPLLAGPGLRPGSSMFPRSSGALPAPLLGVDPPSGDLRPSPSVLLSISSLGVSMTSLMLRQYVSFTGCAAICSPFHLSAPCFLRLRWSITSLRSLRFRRSPMYELRLPRRSTCCRDGCSRRSAAKCSCQSTPILFLRMLSRTMRMSYMTASNIMCAPSSVTLFSRSSRSRRPPSDTATLLCTCALVRSKIRCFMLPSLSFGYSRSISRQKWLPRLVECALRMLTTTLAPRSVRAHPVRSSSLRDLLAISPSLSIVRPWLPMQLPQRENRSIDSFSLSASLSMARPLSLIVTPSSSVWIAWSCSITSFTIVVNLLRRRSPRRRSAFSLASIRWRRFPYLYSGMVQLGSLR